MTDSRALQHQVSTNVKVLMAVRGIATQTELASRLGLDRTLMANRFSGKRPWRIEDLADLAEVFGVEPGALLGDTGALIAAAGPTVTAVNGSVNLRYLRPNPSSITAYAQVLPFRQRGQRHQGIALLDAPNMTIVRHVG